MVDAKCSFLRDIMTSSVKAGNYDLTYNPNTSYIFKTWKNMVLIINITLICSYRRLICLVGEHGKQRTDDNE